MDTQISWTAEPSHDEYRHDDGVVVIARRECALLLKGFDAPSIVDLAYELVCAQRESGDPWVIDREKAIEVACWFSQLADAASGVVG